MDLEKERTRHDDLVQQAEEITALAESENRELSKEEHRKFEDLMQQAEQVDQRIKRQLRIDTAKAASERSHQPPTKPELGEKTPAEYYQPVKFRSLGEQMQCVMRAALDPRNIDNRLSTRAVTGLNEGVPSDGGFLVQTDFAAELLQKAYQTGQLASRCRRIPISANANGLKINAVKETSRANGSRWGGIQAYWSAEAGTKTASLPQFRQIELNLKKLVGLCYATDELLADASAMESVVTQGFADEFAFKLDDAVMNGVAGVMPLGIMQSAALVSVAKENGQPADTLQPENLIKMWSRCFGPSRLNAVWFINQDIEPQLYTQGILVGTGGSTVYMPPGGLSAQPYGTLFGRPVIPVEQCATLGDKGDVVLADLSQYVLIDKGGLQSAQSIHVRFVNDESVFRFVYRVDGAPVWEAALTPFSGSTNTLSPFVTLDARA